MTMQQKFRLLGARLKAFRDDQSGMMALEAILVIPLLFWAYMGIFVMFDAFKKQTDGLRVTYAVADAISREKDAIDQTYLDSVYKLTNFMTRSPQRVTQRVTVVCYSPSADSYAIAWSMVQGPKMADYPAHTNETLDANANRLPNLVLGEQAVLVETFMDYAPIWDVGLTAKTFDYWVFTRPRFAEQVKWESEPAWVCPTT